MVKVDLASTTNPTYPLAREWDQAYRQNQQVFQTEIDKLTYSLQRKQRSHFALSYPKFYQADIQRLKALQTLQELGAIKQQEIDSYKNVEPSIQNHYDKTFKTTSALRPSLWQMMGVGLLAGSAVLGKPLWSVSSFLILAPLALKFSSTTSVLKTKEFLDFTLKVRVQKCLLEKLTVDNGDNIAISQK